MGPPPVADSARRGGGSQLIIGAVTDVTERVRSVEMKDAVQRELQHRIGNLAALVSVIARQSARSATDVATYARDLVARIETLTHATRLLSGSNWRGTKVRELVSTALAPFDGLAEGRTVVRGPDVTLGAGAGQALVMGLHELATNAAKYGALSVPGGRIEVDWKRDGPGGLALRWRETGVGPVAPPEHRGFGSTILTTLLPAQLDGTASHRFEADGLCYDITVSADHVQANGAALDTGRP